MMKTLKLLIFSKKTHCNSNVRSGFSSYCTKTSISSSDTLYKRIFLLGAHKVSIVPILDQWVEEGRPILAFGQPSLRIIFKRLRNYKRYTHALQLLEWMTDSSNMTSGDVAVKLDLIFNIRGLGEAEKYLSNVSDNLKTFKVYGALLNCYAKRNLVEKAEAVMQIMRSSGCNMELSCNVMLNLYSKLGKREKLEKLVREMEEKGITYSIATFCILLNAYAADADIEAMEKLFIKMKQDPQVNLNWNVYCIVAKGYLRAGLPDKASDMLKNAEKLIKGGYAEKLNKGRAYQFLLTMYASLGNKDEVIRIWHLYKKREKIENLGYFYMMRSLIRLDDIDLAEKILQEWEALKTSYDFRIPNVLINAYNKKGLLRKSESLVNRAVESGKKVPASTWDHLATGYCKDNQMDKAVDAMKKAIFSCQGTGWTLNRIAVAACLEYLKNKGDAEEEEFSKLLEERGILSKEVTRIHENGSSDIGIFDEIKDNDEELVVVDMLSLESKSGRDDD